jgi:hypothetical protein
MGTITSRRASEVGVLPFYIKGMEDHGLTYGRAPDKNYVMGAQCAYCHAIVWFDSRRDPILTKEAPASVPPSGPQYQEYYKGNLNKFLSSIPACPCCKARSYDYFINNVDTPRHADGTPVEVSWERKIEYIYVPPENTDIWWYTP